MDPDTIVHRNRSNVLTPRVITLVTFGPACPVIRDPSFSTLHRAAGAHVAFRFKWTRVCTRPNATGTCDRILFRVLVALPHSYSTLTRTGYEKNSFHEEDIRMGGREGRAKFIILYYISFVIFINYFVNDKYYFVRISRCLTSKTF